MKVLLALLFSLSTANALTIGAYNIRNFDYDQRYRIHTDKEELNKIIQELNVDILSVEEINDTQEFEKFVASKLPHHDTELSRCGGAHGQRLGFVYNKKKVELLSFHEDLSISDPGHSGGCDSGARPLAIGLFRIRSTGQKFYGMTAHLKSGSNSSSRLKRQKQFAIITDIVQELMKKTGVRDYFLAGDLNTTDFYPGGSDRRLVEKFTKELNMIDMTQNAKCTAYWWGGSDDQIETPSVLDHIIVTKGLIKTRTPKARVFGHCQKVNCREVPIGELGASYARVSDHCPITASIQ